MKLIRHGSSGQEKPGILDADGGFRDLSSIVTDIDGESLSPDSLSSLGQVDLMSLPVVDSTTRLGPCVGNIGKLVCIGLNYSDHAKESGMPIPTEPIVFMKATSAISGPNDNIELVRESEKTDWEVELGIVIGSHTKYVSEDDALDHVAGYCVVNDISERHWQLERQGNWTKGKSGDTYGPVGPWIETDLDPQSVDIITRVIGTEIDRGSTSGMTFGCYETVSRISQFVTLNPGDLILTGAPGAVDALKPGDVIDVEIAEIGCLSNTVAAE